VVRASVLIAAQCRPSSDLLAGSALSSPIYGRYSLCTVGNAVTLSWTVG
jgi:hypothetical protein